MTFTNFKNYTAAGLLGASALLMSIPALAQGDEPVAPPPYHSADSNGPAVSPQNGTTSNTTTNAPNATSNGNWRRLGDQQVAQNQNGAPPQGYPQQGYPPQNRPPQNYPPQGYPAQGYPAQGYPAQNYPQPNYPPPPQVPAQLTIPAGTFLTVRLNSVLSSDHNQQGDGFTASLVKPVVVNGFIVADRGQTIAGRVAEAKKAGRVEGTSRLGVELTDLTLIDGQPSALHTQLVNRSGGTSVGRDVAGAGTATAVGAAAGAAADGGRGAGIGAGAGAAAGIIGVLLTRGRPTVLYPEMILTFRVEEPIVISTARSPQAFRVVGPGDYDQPQDRPRLAARPAPYYGPVYGPGWGYGYPYYYGPRVAIGFGGYYGGRWGRWR